MPCGEGQNRSVKAPMHECNSNYIDLLGIDTVLGRDKVYPFMELTF